MLAPVCTAPGGGARWRSTGDRTDLAHVGATLMHAGWVPSDLSSWDPYREAGLIGPIER